MKISRRQFIGTAISVSLAEAQKSGRRFKVSLNAYSFNKMLNDAIKGRAKGITLLEMVDFAAENKFDAVDPTGYFFPGYPKVPENSYVDELKKRIADQGLEISGTGVRNNFTTADKSIRDQGVEHIKDWVEVAARLGAPVIRVFADTQMRAQTWHEVSKGASRADVQNYIVEALRECAEQGKKYKVNIGVQNHGDFLQTAEELMTLVKAVGSDYCGPIVDTGYFKTKDPYIDIAEVARHALNWQIKQSVFGEDSEIPTDLDKLMRIIRKSGYSGYLPIETLSPRGKPYDPFTVIPDFEAKLKAAIAATA